MAHSFVKLNKKKKQEKVTAVLVNMLEISPELEAEIFTAAPAAGEAPQQ